jgi:alpha-L-rhamnosidase
MMSFLSRSLILAACLSAAAPAAHAASTGELTVVATSTNARTRPLGIAADDISLAWTLAAQARGAQQQAYQVRVGVAPGSAATWDSG